MKSFSLDTPSSPWKKADEVSPAEARELYIVAQQVGEEIVRAAAWWEQDGNGAWGWNKEGVTHWTEWPQLPTTAKS